MGPIPDAMRGTLGDANGGQRDEEGVRKQGMRDVEEEKEGKHHFSTFK